MYKETTGEIISASKQWWLKINSKSFRTVGTDGALYPYIIKVKYTVEGKYYTKRKWINAGVTIPDVGAFVKVQYDENKPKKVIILL